MDPRSVRDDVRRHAVLAAPLRWRWLRFWWCGCGRRPRLPLGTLALAVPLVALAGAPVRAGEPRLAAQVYQDLAASLVRVESRYGASIFAPPGAGSGVVVGDAGLIATANHVVQGASEVWVEGVGQRKQRAEILRRSPEHDLALIRVANPARLRSMVPSRGPSPVPGQCVLALGNVMNRGIGIFRGIVALTWCDDCTAETQDSILTDITAPPGLSGGALVDCAEASLIGIVTFGILALDSRAATAGIIGAAPAAQIVQLMKQQAASSLER